MGWLFLMVAGSFLVPAVAGVLIGSGRQRQLAFAAAGVVFWSGWAVWAVTLGCADGYDCAPAVVWFAALAVIWLVGVCAAALVRRDRGRPGWRTAAAASVALLFVGTGFVFERYAYEIWTLGCPTSEELERPWTVEEVVEAFEEQGRPLEPGEVPSMLPRPEGARAYRGVRAFRHETAHATLYVVVCRVECRLYFPRRRGPSQGERGRFSGEARPNVVAVITDDGDRRASERLRRPLDRALAELDRYDYSSRCYGR